MVEIDNERSLSLESHSKRTRSSKRATLSTNRVRKKSPIFNHRKNTKFKIKYKPTLIFYTFDTKGIQLWIILILILNPKSQIPEFSDRLSGQISDQISSLSLSF